MRDSQKEVQGLRQVQSEMQMQLKEMSVQLSRLQQHQPQNSYDAHHGGQQHPGHGSSQGFAGHYANGIPNGSQHAEPARTLPPPINGLASAPPTLAPMQGIQYSDDRR